MAVSIAAALVAATVAVAKGPTGTVAVSGQVNSVVSTASVEATVVVETRKESASQTTQVVHGDFTVEVPFSTHSWSFLGKDYCGAVPDFVEVRVTSGGKVLVRTRLSFKGQFEMVKPYKYRLKEKLSLEVSNIDTR